MRYFAVIIVARFDVRVVKIPGKEITPSAPNGSSSQALPFIFFFHPFACYDLLARGRRCKDDDDDHFQNEDGEEELASWFRSEGYFGGRSDCTPGVSSAVVHRQCPNLRQLLPPADGIDVDDDDE